MNKKSTLTLIPIFVLLLSSCRFSDVFPTNYLVIDTMPYKTSYKVGEYFTSEGLLVKDNNDQFVTDYSLSIEDGTQLLRAKTYSVVVAKEGYKSTSFSIQCIQDDTDDKTFDFYYINDTHGAFSRQNTESNYLEAGMSYISTYLKERKNENSLILSGGDMFQGGIESNSTHGDIMIDAMNEIGFDAMALGNHEFDWGASYIDDFAEKLDCPILACNTFYNSDKTTRPSSIKPYTVIYRDGINIGIIGAQIENMNSSISGSISSEYYFPDPTEYVRECALELRNELECTIVIAIFHDGGFDDSSDQFKFTSLTEYDSKNGHRYLDGIFLAHDHRYKDGKINGVPYLESACNGRYVGKMTFNLRYAQGEYSIISSSTSNTNAYYSCTVNDPNIDALLVKYQDQIGDPDEVICNFNYSYTKENFVTLICQAMYWFVNENKGEFGGENVYFTSHNLGGVRVNSISSGDFTYRDLITTMPFDNEICIQTCTYSNIYNMDRSNSYRTYYDGDSISDLPYDSETGLIKAATISYIAENETNQKYIQQSYVKYYGHTAKTILVEYLKEFDDIL